MADESICARSVVGKGYVNMVSGKTSARSALSHQLPLSKIITHHLGAGASRFYAGILSIIGTAVIALQDLSARTVGVAIFAASVALKKGSARIRKFARAVLDACARTHASRTVV